MYEVSLRPYSLVSSVPLLPRQRGMELHDPTVSRGVRRQSQRSGGRTRSAQRIESPRFEMDPAVGGRGFLRGGGTGAQAQHDE